MSGAVEALKGLIPEHCHATSCKKDGCKVSLKGLQSNRIIVDMDCEALGIPDNQKRCDYLYVGEKRKTQVVPIELKSGKVPSASDAVEQLQKGADQADGWLPSKTPIRICSGFGAWRGYPQGNSKEPPVPKRSVPWEIDTGLNCSSAMTN